MEMLSTVNVEIKEMQEIIVECLIYLPRATV